MRRQLLRKYVNNVEREIFNCQICGELSQLRRMKECNCPVLGFSFDHYVHARIASIGEAPGIYKPHKGEIYIDKLEDFHNIYDKRIQEVALIGKRMMKIYNKANVTWADIQHFNVICCSPPNYRKPTFDEWQNCLPFLKRRIDLMEKKRLIVAFGKVARGAIKQLKYDLPVVYVYHPSFIFNYMPSDERPDYIKNISKKIQEYLS